MDKATFLKVIIDADDDRDRSKQTEIGVSQLGGCKRQVWHQLQGAEKTNETLRLAAWMGTAIHNEIERSFKKAIDKGLVDSGVLLEKRFEASNGLPPATIDFYDPVSKTITDWKTIKLSGIPYFGKLQQRYQVHTYAYICIQHGLPVDNVQLFGIPRDGTENNLVDTWIEPYDEAIALEALAWLAEVESLTEAPEPERDPVTFCKDYCDFYGSLCQGKGKSVSGEPITDDTATRAAKTYLEILSKEKALAAEKDAAKAALEGYNGVTFEGITVNWSEIAGRSTPDTDAIEKALGSVPMKQGNPSTRLTVK
jgi:hypothetical protein